VCVGGVQLGGLGMLECGMGDGGWESLLTLEAELLRVRAGTYDCVAGRLEESPKRCLSCCHGGCHELSNESSLSVGA
jgi:hypothetical protein